MDLSVCCIKGCDEKTVALGLCVNHYRRNKMYGSPMALKQHNGMFRNKTAIQRFEMQVKKRENGCWEWTGGVDQDGYGSFRAEANGQIFHRVHRWSWAFHNNQQVPKHGFICHTCDNPRCANPEHLFLGDATINNADKMSKGRFRVARGEKGGHAVLTYEQARAILSDPRPYAAIAYEYGVKPSTIGSIKQRISWRDIDDVEPVKPKRVSARKGVSDKVTPEIVRDIRTSTLTGKELAAKYGLSPQAICGIRKRRSWAHVE